MRPIKLTMSAFCSYAKTETIDFSCLGKGGTYLITGDTGAGKTTIFDAIAYALYGEPSGDDRKASMLRNTMADSDTMTYVILEFEHQGKCYKIERHPSYLRPKKKGEGEVEEKATASLTMPDGRVIADVKSVNSTIEEVLGLPREQFLQIVMLAQGEFEKFLVSDTKTKNEIFRNIFSTQKFIDFDERLKSMVSDKEKEKEGVDTVLKQIRTKISCDNGSDLYEIAQKAKTGDGLTIDETLALLDKLIEADSKLQGTKEAEQKQLQERMNNISESIGSAEKIEKEKMDLQEQIKLWDNTLMPAFDDAKKAKEEADEALKGKDDLIQKSASIKSILPEYANLDSARKQLSKAQNDQNELESKIDEGNKAAADYEEKIKSANAVIESLRNAEADKAMLESRKNDLDRKMKSLADLRSKLSELASLNSELRKAEEAEAHAQLALKTANDEQSATLASYQNSIAGELAEKLEVGKPCPVCGATEHPHLAVRGSNSATKEDVDVSIANTKAASDACSKAISKKSSIKAKTEAKEKEVTAGAQESLGTDDLSAIPSKLEETATNLHKESANTAEKIAAEARNISTRKAEEENVKKYDAESKNIQKAISDDTQSLAEAKANVSKYSEKIAELSAKLTEYKDFNAAKAAMTEYANKAQQLQQESKKAEDAFNAAKSELDKCQGMIDSLKKNLEGAASYNLEELRSRKQQIDAKISEINAAISVISHNLEQNKDAKKDIATKSAELKKIEDEYALLSALERTASGKMIGKDKITFETFVQMTYFDSVLRLANKRFLKMSDGQYELVRSKEQSGGNQRSGLVLDIIDHYNGTQRPANSMSGGEKFLASLSLALGLSDEIQSLSGGIQVDAMFVDEGFGTLDDEYLDRTCKALNELAENNTIVGVISHIKSLEDRIPRHLEVKKDTSGCSHAKFVI